MKAREFLCHDSTSFGAQTLITIVLNWKTAAKTPLLGALKYRKQSHGANKELCSATKLERWPTSRDECEA